MSRGNSSRLLYFFRQRHLQGDPCSTLRATKDLQFAPDRPGALLHPKDAKMLQRPDVLGRYPLAVILHGNAELGFRPEDHLLDPGSLRVPRNIREDLLKHAENRSS